MITDAKLNLLLVEDDAALREVHEHALNDTERFDVSAVNGYQPAKKALETQSFSILITGFNLEHHNQEGLKLIKEVREKEQETGAKMLIVMATTSVRQLQQVEEGAADKYNFYVLDLTKLQTLNELGGLWDVWKNLELALQSPARPNTSDLLALIAALKPAASAKTL